MQEKSSRVVEVLLATVRPIRLLGGKVLGLVALGQAPVVVGFALIIAEAVGSDLLRGSAPLVLGCELLWLVLGYA
jgi:ABC-2 type transport system permease protein